MEELLQDIFGEATGPKLSSLKKACQDALETLCIQESSNRRQSYEVRRSCLLPLQIALDTKRPKLVSFALNGFHKILRDDRFHRGIEPEDDSLWLPSQLLCATASVMYHLPDTQVQIFRMYLSLALSPRRTLNGRLCVWACGRCAEAAGAAPPVAAAARAAASQTLRAYCAQLDEECQELLSEGSPLGRNHNHMVAVGCYSEIIPVIQYLCGRLSEAQMTPKQNPVALFFLDCLLTLMSSLSERVSGNSHFTTFLWQKFCPSLISFLGTPRVDKNIKSREHEGHPVDDSGRGSGALVTAPSFNSRQAKTIYSIANQLVRLVGSTSNLRPVLEALYHRMLLYPPVSHRIEPLRSVREILQNPKRLRQLVLLKNGESGHETHSDDMAIVRLIMDGIEECGRSGNPDVVAAAVECVVSLLDALEKLCVDSNEYMPEDIAAVMLKQWPKLQNGDYTGPLTYQTLARLPSPYRDVVAVLQSEEKDDDSSDTSGPENVSSGSDAEADSDNDNVFLPSRTNNPSSSNDTESDSPVKLKKTIPKTLNLGRCQVPAGNVDLERHNAKQFVKTLQNSLIPKLLQLRTCIEVDEAMQEFASKCCQHNASQPPATACIMNADGIYLATYAALLLTLRLRRTHCYTEPTKFVIPMTEDAFVVEVQDNGLLVYLSATWLRELYQQVLANDLLKDATSSDHALIHLLSDLGGLDQSPVMSDWQKLKEVSMLYNSTDETPQHQASLRWARRILTCIWDSMVTVLSVPLTRYRSRQKLNGIIPIHTFGKKKRVAWEGLTILCLEGLHKAARVSTAAALQGRCRHVLALLAQAAVAPPPAARILATHALSLDILITGGLELGSKAPECWEHIFAACEYVSSFEHSLFGQQGNTATPIVTMQTGRNKTVSMLQADAKVGLDGKEDETCVDVFNFLQPAFGNNMTGDTSVAKIVEACRQEGGNVISGSGAARVCCALAAAADTLFTRLAATTTLPTLQAALQRLAAHQHRLLFASSPELARSPRWWRRGRGGGGGGGGGAARALCRMGDVALRCLKAARPLAHRMAIWTVVGPHFMQAACHKDIQISSLGIQCLHDCATTLLNQQVELPHFHFNEALLKPFENLLCLELCDDDIQEQIISCICEFVETNRMEIRSGWRPLFNTLRAANNSKQYSAILEIFKVFLNTDNTLVFANAALDCILCLLSHIKGLHYDEVQVTESKKKATTPTKPKPNIHLKFSKNSKFIPLNEEKTEKVIVDMCKEALYHLESCADILTMMYNMPKCPIFNTGNRVKGDIPLSVVDPLIPSTTLDITKFIINDNYEEEFVTYRELSTILGPSNNTNNCLLKLDKPSNILKVWYVLIDGLISATVVCSKKNQPAAMETLFKLLKNTIDVPGTYFGLHCINHLLLPMVQNWLRQISSMTTHWDSVLPNFKQCCGMTTDTIVVYLHHLQQINIERLTRDDNEEEFEPIEVPEVTFALKQILLILVECVAQPQEPIARLGASCIRHIILTSGHLLTDVQWEIVCKSLHRACNVSLTPLKQITFAFKENSNSFYGDLAIVKVAARRDCSVNDNVRLHAMAQQVFFNEHLKVDSHSKLTQKNSSQNLMLIDDRSYIFLVYLQETLNSLNPELYTARIPHRGLVVGLLAHQILVQIIATVLIQSSSDVFHGINNILLESFQTGTNICNYKFFLNAANSDLLLKALDLSYIRAMQFDCRPGLKFLVQKVSNLDYAANLYKQTTSSWLIKMIALTEIFFCGAKRFQYDPLQVNLILDKNRSVIYPSEYERYVFKARDLKSTWELLCNSYVKHLINVSDFDEPDNIKERVSISSTDSNCSSTHCEEYYAEDIEETSQTTKADLNLVEENDECLKPRPFTFADFKASSRPSSITVEIHNENDTNLSKETAVAESNTLDMDISSESEGSKNDCEINDENENRKQKFVDYKKVTEVIVEEKEINISTDFENRTERAESRKVNITICDGPTFDVNKNKNLEPLLPPQPVPPEIEQQRALSISKDAEVQRHCLQNILMAYLELVLTFPTDRIQLISPVLHTGFYQLAKTVSDPQLLERINIFLDKKDFSQATR